MDVQYIPGNPLDYDELTAKIDVTRYEPYSTIEAGSPLMLLSGLFQRACFAEALSWCWSSKLLRIKAGVQSGTLSLQPTYRSCALTCPRICSALKESMLCCSFTTAIVLCDQSWVDPDLDDTNGIQVREQRDMLRLESQILLVQLHIRKSLMVTFIVPFLSLAPCDTHVGHHKSLYGRLKRASMASCGPIIKPVQCTLPPLRGACS
jgi:hypothetical protein